ncbi:MAG: bifunctional 5,10-methylenetetrahydrofolate dehydrogenase/5,10-methenyltetrahydrofolate cyclohydrolase [Candidatus Eisenbacteria bacterium]
MSARILESKEIAAQIRREIAEEVRHLAEVGSVPGLAMMRVGEDPATLVYMNAKAKASDEVGIKSAIVVLPADSDENSVRTRLEELSSDASVHGVIVQVPLPSHLDAGRILGLVPPEKDVDGFHPLNVGRLGTGEPLFVPATPMGIVELLARSGVTVEGAHVVVIGRSNVVGRPLANYLSLKKPGLNATVTLCHSGTCHLSDITKSADILVAAMGSVGFVTASMVRAGAVVVDVGTNRVPDQTARSGYRLKGDVRFEEVRGVASAITPVPGGVGPMTVVMLLRNTVKACRLLEGN